MTQPTPPGTPPAQGFDPTQAGQQAFLNASLRAAAPAPAPGFDPTQGGQQLLQQITPQAPTTPEAQGETNPFLHEQLEKNEEQSRLEAEHGKLATFGVQAARGALNVVLLAPALVGAAAQGIGAATGWSGLEQFGKEYGEASNGRDALATIFNPSVVFAGDAEKANNAYESTRKTIEEQSEAWPLLSTVSRVAGGAALSFGVAGLASAGASAATEGTAEGVTEAAKLTLGQTLTRAATTGALEGAEGGAQGAYETGRPYRDVVGSTLMGAFLGGATAATAAGGAYWFEHAEPVEALHDFARGRVFKAIGGLKSDVHRAGGAEEANQIADDIMKTPLSDGETVLPKSALKAASGQGTSIDEIRERIQMGREEFGEKLGNMQRQVGTYLDEHEPGMLPKAAYIREKLEDIARPLEQSSQLASRGADVRALINDIDKATRDDGTISLADLIRIKRDNAAFIYPKGSSVVPASREALEQAGGILSKTISDVADAGAAKMGAGEAGAYRELNRVTQSFIKASAIVNRGAEGQFGNRAVSLTDSIAGAATFAADLAGGGGLVSAAKGLGAAILHKYARERGPAVMAALAERLAESPGRFTNALERIGGLIDKTGEVGIGTEAELLGSSAEDANAVDKIGMVGGTVGGTLLRDLGWHDSRDSRIISVRDAGGREAQSVIAELGRAKERVLRESAAAGDNPEQRNAAQVAAQNRLATALALKAGPYSASDWQSDKPTPLQRVLYRGELLDATSQDVAKAAQQVAASKPQIATLSLDPDRVRKLTKDANGPQAIGGVQLALRQTLEQTNDPRIHGAAMRTLSAINAADAPQTMIAGHEFLRTLAQMYGGADAQTQADINIAAAITKRSLGDDAFGAAGRAYAAVSTPANEQAAQLLDPTIVREALRNVVVAGSLSPALTALQQSLDASHAGAAALTGEKTKTPKGLPELVAKAEQALLLDGGPAGRVFDFFRPGGSVGAPQTAPQMTIMNAVRPQVERLLPALGKPTPERYPAPAPALKQLPKTQADLQSLYSERMQDLAAAAQGAQAQQALRSAPNIGAATLTAIGSEAQQRAAQLLADMPKAAQDLRGSKYRGLSSNDLRRADAMYEATVAPLSIFEDFKSGNVDYTKVQYAWKQYPGLQQAAQAGLLDTIHTQLSDVERSAIPDTTLTQLDFLLGFDGRLQPSVDRSFAARVSAAAQQEEQQRPPPRGEMELATSKPTFTERLSEARGRQ